MALYSAAEEVIATQSAKLAIQCRFVADMKLIWMLQLRFERRTGKNPYTLVEHPKYRAGYDFMLLRSALGHVPESLVHWWEDFVDADEQKRADSKSRQKEQRDEERFTEEATRYESRNKSPRRRRSSAEKAGVEKQTSEAKLAEKTDDAASVVSAKPKRRRRRPKSDKAESKLELS